MDALFNQLTTVLTNAGHTVPQEVHDTYAANKHDYNGFYLANRQLIDSVLAGNIAGALGF